MSDIHPSMVPGAIIGYRKNGTPIRLIAGGAPEDEGGTGTGEDTTGDAGTGGQDNGQEGDEGGAGSRASTGQDDTPKVIAALRNDFKAERTKRQAAEKQLADVTAAQTQLEAALNADKADRAKQMDALAKAMGLKADDEPPTPEKLAAQLADAHRTAEGHVQAREAAEARAADALAVQRRERALVLAAPKHDANTVALLDSRSFMEAIGRLDPGADGFSEQLAEAIKTAVDANPAYKATVRKQPPAKSSGGEFNANPGNARQWTDDDVAKASPSEVKAAMTAGLLQDLGIGIPRKRRYGRTT